MFDAERIAEALGGHRNGPGRFLAKCVCHADGTPSLSLRDADDGALLVFCFGGCGGLDVLAELRRLGLLERHDRDRPRLRRPIAPRPVRPPDPDRGDLVRRLWRDALPVAGTLGERYLQNRGLTLPADLSPRVLRFHPKCAFGPGVKVPALVVAFESIEPNGAEQPVAIHRIGLDVAGDKIGKRMLGPVRGAAVKLDPRGAATHELCVAEGIETALAVRSAGWAPIWACGSAGAIARLELIPGITRIVIFADNDQNRTGQNAAHACAERWAAAGRRVRVYTPLVPGSDWLDALSA
jgi:Toprim domain